MNLRFSKLPLYSSAALVAFALTGWVVATSFPSPDFYISQPPAYPVPQYQTPTLSLPIDTPPPGDSLKYPFNDRISDPYSLPYNNSPLYLHDPSNIKTNIEYDPDNNQY